MTPTAEAILVVALAGAALNLGILAVLLWRELVRGLRKLSVRRFLDRCAEDL